MATPTLTYKSILAIMQCVCSDQHVGKRPRRLMSLFIENRMRKMTTQQCASLFNGDENYSVKLAAVVRQVNIRFAAFGIKIHRMVEGEVETWYIDTISASR